ncbi:MAG: hypothetical protein FJW14_06495 [Acidimicrobiia bacterium]|nr:hypothetical protein [Acidimicrobiia bacterium]
MSSRSLLCVVLCAALAAPLAAQTPQGWRMRVDESTSAEDPDDRPDLKVVTVGSGMRVTGGPAGTFWNPKDAVTGNFAVRASFTLMKPSSHTNYYGLIFGGRDIEGPKQTYVYFLVAQNGTYLIRRRAGEEVTDIQGRMMHAAVQRPDAKGTSVNALEVRVAGNTVSYVINGTVVHTAPKGALVTDGLVGVRVNHVLDVQVDGFTVQRG